MQEHTTSISPLSLILIPMTPHPIEDGDVFGGREFPRAQNEKLPIMSYEKWRSKSDLPSNLLKCVAIHESSKRKVWACLGDHF